MPASIFNGDFVKVLKNKILFKNGSRITGLSAKGRLITHNGTDATELSVGNDHQVMIADSTQTAGIRYSNNIPSFIPNAAYQQGHVILHGGVAYYANNSFTAGATFSGGDWTSIGAMNQGSNFVQTILSATGSVSIPYTDINLAAPPWVNTTISVTIPAGAVCLYAQLLHGQSFVGGAPALAISVQARIFNSTDGVAITGAFTETNSFLTDTGLRGKGSILSQQVVNSTPKTYIVQVRAAKIAGGTLTAGTLNLDFFSGINSIGYFIFGAADVFQAANYRRVGFTTNTTISASQDLIFDSAQAGNITYNTGTGVFTLTAGVTYELIAYVRATTFSAGTAGEATLAWVDATTNTQLSSSNIAYLIPNNHASQFGNEQSVCHAIITAGTTTTVKVRCTSSNGTVTISSLASAAFVRQLGTSSILTANYQPVVDVSVTDTNYSLEDAVTLIRYTALTAPRSVVLPSPSAVTQGRIFTIKNETSSTSAITYTGQTLDGAASGGTLINTAYGSVRIYSNGTAWFRA